MLRYFCGDAFPRVLAYLDQFAHECDAVLQRVAIVRLEPHSSVFRHVDSGSYYFIRDRFHLVLSSVAGSHLRSGPEEVEMHEGEIWWFNNKEYHESRNSSGEWRIHVIFDLLPTRYAALARNALPPIARDQMSARALADELAEARRQLLRKAILDRAFLRATDQPLRSCTGRNYSWMLDLRRILVDAECLDAAAELFIDTYRKTGPFQVGGIEMAGIPLLTAILLKFRDRGIGLNGFIIRKERKAYGTASPIEGQITSDPIILVEDLTNSADTLERVRVTLDSRSKRIAGVFTIVDFRSAGGLRWRTAHEVAVRSVFTSESLGLPTKAERDRPASVASFNKIWSFSAPNPNLFHRVPKSFPATDGKHVFFGSDNGAFWCLNATDGSVAWSFRVKAHGHKNIWSAPAIWDNRVYFGSYDGNVYCLDSNTGQEVWRFQGADWVGSSPALAPRHGLLYIGLEHANPHMRGSIVALDLNSGAKAWEDLTHRYTHASPTYSEELDVVVCGSNDDELLLFDAVQGTRRWRFHTQSYGSVKGSIRHAAAFDIKRRHVITGSANGRIYVVDVETGSEVWSVKTDNSIYTIPLILGDFAFVGSMDKHMYVLDLESRRVRQKLHLGAKVLGPPRYFGNRVYFGTNSGKVHELNPETLEISTVCQLPDAVTNAVSFDPVNGQYYVLTYANELYAFSRSSTSP